MKKIALVTGATAGIGRSTALKLAAIGFDVIITGRRKDRLEEVKNEIETKHAKNVYSLHFDVRSREEVEKAIDSLPGTWKEIDVLVNNAGLAVGMEHLQKGVYEDWERMIDTNIKGLLYITRTVSPFMVKRGKGHIVNLGSIAGKEVYEKGNVYCATKQAVDALSKAMRIDMVQHGIKVTNIAPGLVETEFSLVRFKGDEEKAKVPYSKYPVLTGDDIAEVIAFAIRQPEHVCLNDIVITPTGQASAYYHKNV